MSIKRVIFIPIKDKSGLYKDKLLRITEGSKLHKKIVDISGGKLPKYIIE
jgi:hypothetical protein